MSLNDNVLDDLEGNPGLNEQPEPIQKVVLATKVKQTYDEPPTSSGRALLNKLPTTVDNIKLLQDGASKIIELEDIQQEIEEDDSMSQSSAELVSTAFEGFFDNVRLSEFTRTPSKTNLVFTKRYMASQIKLAKEDFQYKFKTFLEKPLDDALDVLEELQEDYIPELRAELANLQSSCSLLKEKISSNKNLILVDGVKFIDLRKIALQHPEEALRVLTNPEWRVLSCAIQNFQHMWKEYGVLRAVLVGVLQNKSLQEIFDCEHMGACTHVPLTIIEFTQIFASTRLMDVVDEMYAYVDGCVSKVEQLREEGMKLVEDQQKSQDFIVENGKAIQEMASAFHHYSEAVATLILLIPNAKVLVSGFATFD